MEKVKKGLTDSDGVFQVTWSLAKSKKLMWKLHTNRHEESKLLQVKKRRDSVGDVEGELFGESVLD